MNFNFKLKPDSLSKKYRFYYLLWEMGCAGLLLAWYAHFIYIIGSSFLHTHALSSLFYLIYELMIVLFLVIRNLPKEISFSPYDWFIGIFGTVGSTLLRPVENGMLPEMDFLIVLQLLGIIISVVGLASLSKSFGVVPANRGIKTNGLYRYIRHPLYSGYFFTLTAFVLQNANIYNIAVLGMFFALKILRILAEERLLLEDPEYFAYAAKTKWRIIPFVW